MKMKIINYQLPLVFTLLVCSTVLEFCKAGLLDGLDGELLGGLIKTSSVSRTLRKKKPTEALSAITNDGRGILEKLLGGVDLGDTVLPFDHVDLIRRPYDHPICYDDDIYGCGPKHWGGKCLEGEKQSPIDIQTKDAKEITHEKLSVRPLVYNKAYSEKRAELYVANTGHSVSIKVTNNGTSDAELYMSDLRLTYRFSQLHFHWGSDNSQGSEHKIDGKIFPMEMHLVHYLDTYEDTQMAFATGGEKAACVIAIFVEIGDTDNLEFQPIVDAVKKKGIKNVNGFSKFKKEFRLYDLLPKQDTFYRYEGSLTVPQCTEKVLWIVYPEPIKISREQMSAFRKVNRDFEEQKMSNNFRPVQPLNSRRVSFFNYTVSQ